MPQRLPEYIEPRKLAESRRTLEGRLPIAQMSRLASMLNSVAGHVDVELAFGIDNAGVVCISGRVSTTVDLVCQRCMETMQYLVNEAVSLAAVRSEQQIKTLPDYYEPVMVDEDGAVSLSAVIEDELILALPASVLHEPEDCPARNRLDKYASEQQHVETGDKAKSTQQKSTQQGQDQKNPFAALAQLKKKQGD